LPAVRRLVHIGGNTNIADGLLKARTELFNVTSRPNSRRIAILIADGVANRKIANTLPEATNLKRAGVEIFTVGVGGADREQLRQIASSPDETHNFYVIDPEDRKYDYARLDTVVQALSSVICEFAANTSSRIPSTTPSASPDNSVYGSPSLPTSTSPGTPFRSLSTVSVYRPTSTRGTTSSPFTTARGK